MMSIEASTYLSKNNIWMMMPIKASKSLSKHMIWTMILCNIPLDEYWNITSRCVKGQVFMENKYDGNVYYEMTGKHELSTRVV
jgi:hypothetical protein